MSRLLQDLRFAARQYARTPGLTALAVASLALGIGVNSSIFSIVNAFLLRDLPAVRPEQLVDVYMGKADEYLYATASYPDFADLRSASTVFSELAALNLQVAASEHGGRTELLFGEEVSGNYFDLLGIEPALGRSFLPEEDRTPGTHPVVILGHRLWQRRFGGDPGAIGETIELNGIAFTVIGVAPPSLAGTYPGVSSDFWSPLMMSDRMSESPNLGERGARSLFLKGRLKPGVTLERAQAELSTVAKRLATAWPDTNEDVVVTLVPTRDVVLNPGIDGPIFGVAGLLMGIVALVLLIACSNIANLLLARASERRKEIAVRLAIGAGRGRLVRQLLTESLLLAAAGGALGLLVALWTARLIVAWKPPIALPLSLDVALDWKVVGFTLGLSVLTGIVCGLAPALQASRPELVPALKDGAGALGRRHRRLGLRNLLVVAQVATSTVLLVGAGLFLRSLANAQTIDPGFALRKGVVAHLALGLGGAYDETGGRAFYARLLERARALPGVRSAALADNLPLGLSVHVDEIEVEGQPPAETQDGPEVDRSTVGPGYFATMGIDLPWGRDFTDRDAPESPGVVIVNEAAARRFWPGESPLGKRLRFAADKPWMEVVGVARDGKYRTLGEAPRPFVYDCLGQDYSSSMALVVATDGDERAMFQQVERLLDELDPSLPVFDSKTMSEHLSVMLFPARMGAALLAAFGALGLVLASVGLYGVVAGSVARRTREVGIRMAIGAGRADVLGLVVREGMALAAAGLAVGIGLALAAARALKSLLYGIGTSDPATFAGVAVLLAGVALLANLVPARRASRLDPLVALRHD